MLAVDDVTLLMRHPQRWTTQIGRAKESNYMDTMTVILQISSVLGRKLMTHCCCFLDTHPWLRMAQFRVPRQLPGFSPPKTPGNSGLAQGAGQFSSLRLIHRGLGPEAPEATGRADWFAKGREGTGHSTPGVRAMGLPLPSA